MHAEALTIEGTELQVALSNGPHPDGAVVRKWEAALSTTGGAVVLKGNLAPDGVPLKTAGLKSQHFAGHARVFDTEEARTEGVAERRYKAGDVLVIRNEGPAAIYGQGMGEEVALLTDAGSPTQLEGCASAMSVRTRQSVVRLHR